MWSGYLFIFFYFTGHSLGQKKHNTLLTYLPTCEGVRDTKINNTLRVGAPVLHLSSHFWRLLPMSFADYWSFWLLERIDKKKETKGSPNRLPPFAISYYSLHGGKMVQQQQKKLQLNTLRESLPPLFKLLFQAPRSTFCFCRVTSEFSILTCKAHIQCFPVRASAHLSRFCGNSWQSKLIIAVFRGCRLQ